MVGINIDPVDQVTQPTLDIDTGGNTRPTSPDTANVRAAKISFGLAGVLGNPSHQDLYQQIVSGQEQTVRQRAAAQWDINNSQAHVSQIKQAALEGNTDALKSTAANPPAPVNPDGVMEHGFARSWISSLYDTGVNLGNTDFHDAAKEEPDFVAPIGRVSTDTVTKSEWTNTALENLKDANQNQSPMGWAWNEAKGFIPFRDEVRLRGNVEGTGYFSGGPLGSNLTEQIKHLYAEPLDDFLKDAPRIYDTLKDDPALAMQFFTAGRSASQEQLQNIFSVGQLIPLPSAAAVKGLFRGAATVALEDMAESAIQTGIRDTIKEGSFGFDTMSSFGDASFPTPERIVPIKAAAQEASGDVLSAAATRVNDALEDDLKGRSNPKVRAIEAIPSGLRADKTALGEDTGSWSREQVLRLQQSFDDSAEKLSDRVQNTMRTMQVNWQTASKAVIMEAQEDLKRRFPGWSNRVFNITQPIYDRVSNTWSMGMDLWDSDGQLFAKEAQAKIAANRLDMQGVEIRPKGAGYYLRVYKNLPQDTDIAQGLLTSDDKDKTPWGWVNALIGWGRSPEYTMAENEMSRRHVATYAVGNFRRMLDEEAQKISDLSQGNIRVTATGKKIPGFAVKARAWGRPLASRQAWKEWKRVLDVSRKLPGPDGIPGTTFKTVGEYERFFVQEIGRTPSIPETEAYFAKNKLDLYDHAFRNMAVYTEKANHGAETINLFGTSETGLTRSQSFDAIPLKEIPKGGNFQYLLADGDSAGGRVFNNWGELSAYHKEDQKLDELVSQGRLKIYETWAPEHSPLNGYGEIKDQRIRYIIAKHIETKPLTWDQVPRRGGGHFDYDAGHYIKQAILHRTGGNIWYNGDQTIAAVNIRKMGQDIAEVFDQARIYLLQGNEDEARNLIQSKTDIKWGKFRGMFNSIGKEPPMLSLDEPIQLVPKDRLLIDVDSGLSKRHVNFRNGMREGSKNQQFQVNYTGQRDGRGLFSFKDVGTRNNPIYQTTEAELLDPLVSMNRGLNRIIHSSMMNDYKRYSVHHWIKEVEDNNHLNTTEAHRIKASPFAYFNSPEDIISKGAPVEFRRVMMSNWKKIQQFLGTPSAFDSYLHGLEQKLVDATYSKFGPAYTVVPSWLLNKVTDPVQFMRKMTYHAYMGIFNPAEWLVQNQTWTNIWALSPKNAPAGNLAHMLHRWARFTKDPAILKALDAKAQMMGWQPGGFLEAREYLAQTGFEHVDAEQHAYLNTPMDYHFIKNDMRNFLDAGQFFFKDGVKNVRLGAWYTAFKEYRDLHPTGKLNETDIMKILDKADQYHGHMSRASVSLLQRGISGYPLQFLTYQMRLAEMFTGHRIGDTPQERWLARGRMVALYSALYGVPLSVGLTGLPLGDSFRKSALENGYVVGDKWYQTAFYDGIPSLAMAHVTGNYYNIGGRFGARGVDTLKEFYNVLAGDESSQEALGAAFNYAVPTMSAFGHLMWAIGNQSAYSPTLSDVVDVAKGVTSIRHGLQLAAAARYGEWWNSHEGVEATNVGFFNAMFMAGTGLEPQAQADQFLKGQILHEREEDYKQINDRYQLEVHRGIRAAQDNNDTLANTFFTRAQETLKYLPPRCGIKQLLKHIQII